MLLLVAWCNVSPITRSAVTSAPNRRVATSAAAAFCSAAVPRLAMVAEVPTYCRVGESHTSRSRRASTATSGQLPAAVGMQLVQHQEVQASCCSDQLLALVRRGQDTPEHHVAMQREDQAAVISAVCLQPKVAITLRLQQTLVDHR